MKIAIASIIITIQVLALSIIVWIKFSPENNELRSEAFMWRSLQEHIDFCNDDDPFKTLTIKSYEIETVCQSGKKRSTHKNIPSVWERGTSFNTLFKRG